MLQQYNGSGGAIKFVFSPQRSPVPVCGAMCVLRKSVVNRQPNSKHVVCSELSRRWCDVARVAIRWWNYCCESLADAMSISFPQKLFSFNSNGRRCVSPNTRAFRVSDVSDSEQKSDQNLRSFHPSWHNFYDICNSEWRNGISYACGPKNALPRMPIRNVMLRLRNPTVRVKIGRTWKDTDLC
jgi:hypothetical protein